MTNTITKPLHFKNQFGEKLAAYLDAPVEESPTAYAIYAHCFTCTKNLKTMVKMIKALAESGIAVLRFDFTGIGASEGDFSTTNFSSNVQDVISAATFLEDNFQPPQLLIGHSLGASTVLKAAASIHSSRAVVTLGASYDPSHLGDLLQRAKQKAESEGSAEVVIGGVRYKIQKQFFRDIENIKMGEIIRKLNRPLLILHSPEDQTVPIEHAAKIFRDARHPKSFVSLHPADHLLSNENDAIYAAKVISAWVSRYLISS